MSLVYERYPDAPVPLVPACAAEYIPQDLAAAIAIGDLDGPAHEVAAHTRTTGALPSRGTARTTVEMAGSLRVEPRLRRVPFPSGGRTVPELPFGDRAIARHSGNARVVTTFSVPGLSGPVARLLPALLPRLGPLIDRLPEGPSPARRQRARFEVLAEAIGESGRAAVVCTGRDIYGLTARFLVEAALKVRGNGGLAPAQALDAADFLDAVSGDRDGADFEWRRLPPSIGACPNAPGTCPAAPACPSPARARRCSARARASPADMVFLDLEDSVAPLEKEAARAKVVDAIKNQDWGEKVLCVRVNAWDTEWTYVRRDRGRRQRRRRASRRSCCPRCSRPPRWWPSTCCSPRSRPTPGLPRRPHRHRGPDRDGPRPHQRRGDLRRVAPARDDHPRPGRLLGVDGDAVARRRPADPRVPGRLLPLRVHEDPHGRPGQRPAGHRRAVRARSATPRASATSARAPRSSATTASGRCTPTRSRSSTRCSRPPRSSSTGPGTSSTPTRRPRPRATRKGAVMFGDEMIDEASRKVAIKLVSRGRAGRAHAQSRVASSA